MPRLRFCFLISFCAGLCAFMQAQSTTAPATPAATQVTLGNATMPLTGPWKFHIGDNMAWAQPAFDDSAWGAMDLTPPAGSFDAIIGSSGYVPGWTARGYKGVSGYAWYRLRVDIQDGQSALALKMPDNFDDASRFVESQILRVTSFRSLSGDFLLPNHRHRWYWWSAVWNAFVSASCSRWVSALVPT